MSCRALVGAALLWVACGSPHEEADLAAPAADLGAPVEDLATSVDLAEAIDLAAEIDLAVEVDLAPPVDLSPPDLLPPPGAVRVFVNGAPAAGVSVLVHDAAGAISTTKVTAANGTALLPVPGGGVLVTVLAPVASSPTLYTTRLPGPGAVVDVPLIRGAMTTSVTIDIPAYGGAGAYTISTGSSGGTTPMTATSTAFAGEDLDANGKYGLLLLARATTNTSVAPLAWSYDAYPSTATSLSAGSVPPLAAFSTSFSSRALALADVPGAATGGELYAYLYTAQPGGLFYHYGQLYPSGGAAAQALELPGTGAPASDLFLVAQLSDSAGRYWSIERTGPSAETPVNVSVADPALPAISGLALDLTNAARPAMSWTSTGASTAHHAAVMYYWYTVTSSGYWMVRLPPGTSAVQFPDVGGAAPAASPSFKRAYVAEVHAEGIADDAIATDVAARAAVWHWFSPRRVRSQPYALHYVEAQTN